MGRVEHVVDDGVPVEHDLVHPLGDLRALGLDHRGSRLKDVDRLRANVMKLSSLTTCGLFFKAFLQL